MTRGALDVARTMVKLSIENKIWLTNEELQSLLYLAWIDYYREQGEYLFDEGFEAWRWGPTVPVVYYDYWLHVSGLIATTKAPENVPDAGTSAFLLEILRRYASMADDRIEELTMGEGTPWLEVYTRSEKRPIPMEAVEAAALSM